MYVSMGLSINMYVYLSARIYLHISVAVGLVSMQLPAYLCVSMSVPVSVFVAVWMLVLIA